MRLREEEMGRRVYTDLRKKMRRRVKTE